MKKKILLILMIVALSIFGAISVSAETYGDLTYSVSNGEATVTGCSITTSCDIVIPDTLGGCPVTSIGRYAFRECSNITGISIPESVTSIGEAAFSCCGSITNITIPSSVTSIGHNAFYQCSGLERINVDVGNANFYSEDGVLFDKSKTLLICYPAGKKESQYFVPDGVTEIWHDAFSFNKNLEILTICDGVISIGFGAFYYCSNLESITIPPSVKSIRDEAFMYCGARRAYISDLSSWCEIDFETGYANNPGGLYLNGNPITNLIIPDGVTVIAPYVFQGQAIESITFPESVTIIGDSAFSRCGLKNLTIPNSVTSIGMDAFANCSNLRSVTIGNGVTSISSQAFMSCSNLTSVTIRNGVKRIGDRVFLTCSYLENITIPNSVTSIGDFAFAGCYSIKNVYYDGTEEEWNNIVVGLANGFLDGKIRFSYTKTTLSNNDKSFSVTPINIDTGKTIILALYNGEQFVQMQKAVYTGEAIPFTTTEEYTNAKVMVWDSLASLKPVCVVEDVK